MMSEMEKRLALLENQVAELSLRLNKLEEGDHLPEHKVPQSPRDIDAALLMRERNGTLYEEETMRGALMYAGFAQFGERRHMLQLEYPLPELFTQDLAQVAQIFAALAHPHRLFILRAICQEPRTSQQLQELLGISSPGQLYHHLKELQMAELITQQGRSAYTLVPNKIIHFCIALAVASGLRSHAQSNEQSSEES